MVLNSLRTNSTSKNLYEQHEGLKLDYLMRAFSMKTMGISWDMGHLEEERHGNAQHHRVSRQRVDGVVRYGEHEQGGHHVRVLHHGRGYRQGHQRYHEADPDVHEADGDGNGRELQGREEEADGGREDGDGQPLEEGHEDDKLDALDPLHQRGVE
eukprot:4636725-Amphidinium_carterae.1